MKDVKNNFKLNAPMEYWNLSQEEKAKIVNQCGPDGPLNKLIPDHLLGLKISSECDVHDFMFSKANNQKDFEVADKTFLHNLDRKIERDSKTAIWRIFRKGLARVYYWVVRLYSSFQKDKHC